jgi:hypothetical protein
VDLVAQELYCFQFGDSPKFVGFVAPLTGDFLFFTFGGGNQIIEVSGLHAAEPEPAKPSMLRAGILGLAGALRCAARSTCNL